MKSDDSTDNQLGVCTYLIDRLALRVGNEKDENEEKLIIGNMVQGRIEDEQWRNLRC